MALLTVNDNKLLDLTLDKSTLNTANWAKMMHDTRISRSFFVEKHKDFQHHRFVVEVGVKASISMVLGIGLFFAAPATLLYGAAVALSVSDLVFPFIKLPALSANYTELPPGFALKSPDAWEHFRHEWTAKAQNNTFSSKQSDLQMNMIRLGLVIVTGFALFTAITSGMAGTLGISCVLYAGALFFRAQDETTPYFEADPLPSLT